MPDHPSLLSTVHPGSSLVQAFTSLPFPPAKMVPARPQKQSMAELKLRRLTEHNTRLREDLSRPRIKVSEASMG